MSLSSIDESLLAAAYFRGGRTPSGIGWSSNTDQVLTLSLFYTGDISAAECAERFSRKSYISGLYQDDGELTEQIGTRYRHFIRLLRAHPELLQGGGNYTLPADPTYTACGLTDAGLDLACELIPSFPSKPEFPEWPDRRVFPAT